MANPTLFCSETPSPLAGGRLFCAARRATFSAPSRRKGLARYGVRDENFVLVHGLVVVLVVLFGVRG